MYKCSLNQPMCRKIPRSIPSPLTRTLSSSRHRNSPYTAPDCSPPLTYGSHRKLWFRWFRTVATPPECFLYRSSAQFPPERANSLHSTNYAPLRNSCTESFRCSRTTARLPLAQPNFSRSQIHSPQSIPQCRCPADWSQRTPPLQNRRYPVPPG